MNFSNFNGFGDLFLPVCFLKKKNCSWGYKDGEQKYKVTSSMIKKKKKKKKQGFFSPVQMFFI